MIYKNDTIKLKQKGKDLKYFTFHQVQISPPDENGSASDYSIVSFRFHSTKKSCETMAGDINSRSFTYEGIDKTEEELIEWALTTDQVSNDGVTTIHGANEI